MRVLNIGYCATLLGGLLMAALATGFPQTVAAESVDKPASAGNLKMHGAHPDEDWTTPRMSTTHLTAQPPLVAEKDDRPKFTREMVSVGWRAFDSFHLYVVKPKGVVQPPVVLYLYDYKNDTKRFLNDDYCERITRSGCAAVGFESALSADRFQMRPMHQWFVSELPESMAESAHDVQMVMNYLGTRGDLDLTHIGMFGQGSGASIAILAAGADPRIKALDLLNPWGDWPAWLQKTGVISDADRPHLTQAAFTKLVAPLDPIAWLPRLAGRKIRLIQVRADPSVPAACRAALAKAVPAGAQVAQYDSNIALYGALGHGRLFAWLDAHVKAVGP